MPNSLPTPAFDDPKHHLRLYQGDCLDILAAIPASSVDLVFADPPYFLSNGGITCHAGKMVSVHKGDWDKLPGISWVPLCTIARLLRDEPQPASQSLLPLFHPRRPFL